MNLYNLLRNILESRSPSFRTFLLAGAGTDATAGGAVVASGGATPAPPNCTFRIKFVKNLASAQKWRDVIFASCAVKVHAFVIPAAKDTGCCKEQHRRCNKKKDSEPCEDSDHLSSMKQHRDTRVAKFALASPRVVVTQ